MALPKGISPAYWSTWSLNARTVAQALESGETWVGGWDSVGLYEGNNKIPEYQTITVHLTTHRLILLPESTPPPSTSTSQTTKTPGMQLHLRYIRQTELYNGFMRSSPKITLSLGPPVNETHQNDSWTCGVCGYVNDSSGSSISRSSTKCGLCGVTQDTSRSMSLPASGISTPRPEMKAGVSTGGRVKEIPCPACTFLNHPSISACEICSTPLLSRSTSSSRPSIPVRAVTSETGNDTVRLSFRKGGIQESYRRLKNVLSDKAWDRAAPSRISPTTNGRDSPRPGAGIDGILQTMSLEAKTQEEHRKDAFKDLEVLMVRAGEMVKMAQSLNSKLSNSTSTSKEEETLIRSSLVQLGLPSPALTPDMVRDNQKYLEGLAVELGQLLTGSGSTSSSHSSSGPGTGSVGLMVGHGARGIIGLDEVWGLWMRARGVALLPPSTLMTILPYIPKYTNPPINLLVLPSTLNVLHTPAYAPRALLSRIVSRLSSFTVRDDPQPTDQGEEIQQVEHSLSIIEIASHENLPIGLTKELMESIEQIDIQSGDRDMGLVRDDQAVGDGGVRWSRDIISSWEI